ITWITPLEARTSGMTIRAPLIHGEPSWTDGVRNPFDSVRIRLLSSTADESRLPGATWYSRTARNVSTGIWSTPLTPSAVNSRSKAASGSGRDALARGRDPLDERRQEADRRDPDEGIDRARDRVRLA